MGRADRAAIGWGSWGKGRRASPSPDGKGRSRSDRAWGRWGRGSAPSSTRSLVLRRLVPAPNFPTLTASPSVPPHGGREGPSLPSALPAAALLLAPRLRCPGRGSNPCRPAPRGRPPRRSSHHRCRPQRPHPSLRHPHPDRLRNPHRRAGYRIDRPARPAGDPRSSRRPPHLPRAELCLRLRRRAGRRRGRRGRGYRRPRRPDPVPAGRPGRLRAAGPAVSGRQTDAAAVSPHGRWPARRRLPRHSRRRLGPAGAANPLVALGPPAGSSSCRRRARRRPAAWCWVPGTTRSPASPT